MNKNYLGEQKNSQEIVVVVTLFECNTISADFFNQILQATPVV